MPARGHRARSRAGVSVTIALETARDAAQRDATIDAAHALILAAGSYTAALLALCGLAASVGDVEDAAVLERAAEEMSRVEVGGWPPD